VGIRLVTEILDRYHGPDARKLWLLAWAEKANDRTRAGWPTREVLARRTGRSPSRVSHIADELVAEGVIKRDGGGNRSGPARFILLPLADPEMGAVRAHPKAKVEGAAKAHSSCPEQGAPRTHPQPEVKGAESAGKGAESEVKGADPSPQPAETGPLPLINPQVKQPSEEPPADADAPTAQTIIGGFIDWVRSIDGDLTKRSVGQLAKQVGDLLAQGKSDRHVKIGLADWFRSGQHPATLDSFVNAAINAEARARAAQEAGSQRPPVPGDSTGAARARAAIEAGLRVQAMIDERNRQ
jgi:hypothetical protein